MKQEGERREKNIARRDKRSCTRLSALRSDFTEVNAVTQSRPNVFVTDGLLEFRLSSVAAAAAAAAAPFS